MHGLEGVPQLLQDTRIRFTRAQEGNQRGGKQLQSYYLAYLKLQDKRKKNKDQEHKGQNK
jgi:hypothetical protein